MGMYLVTETRTAGCPRNASAAEATVGRHACTHSQWLSLIASPHTRSGPPLEFRSRYRGVVEWAWISLVVVRAHLWALLAVGEPDASRVRDNIRCQVVVCS